MSRNVEYVLIFHNQYVLHRKSKIQFQHEGIYLVKYQLNDITLQFVQQWLDYHCGLLAQFHDSYPILYSQCHSFQATMLIFQANTQKPLDFVNRVNIDDDLQVDYNHAVLVTNLGERDKDRNFY